MFGICLVCRSFCVVEVVFLSMLFCFVCLENGVFGRYMFIVSSIRVYMVVGILEVEKWFFFWGYIVRSRGVLI